MVNTLTKSILVTGGLGYVGGRLCTHLKTIYPNLRIIVTTRKSADLLPAWADGLDVRTLNILNEGEISQVLKDVNAVVHLASLNEIDSAKKPTEAVDTNTKGTFNLLKVASVSGVQQFIYISTYHVYDIHQKDKIDEKTRVRPIHPYSITHYAAECFVEDFRSAGRLKTLILRLSNSYGYPMDIAINRWTLAFNDFCRQAVTNGKIVLKTAGLQHRDFISMTDVCRAIEHFMFKYEDWGDGLYNLGGNCSMNIYQAARSVASVYNRLRNDREVTVEMQSTDDGKRDCEAIRYSIEKLVATGFCLIGNMDHEIEKTLECAGDLINARS